MICYLKLSFGEQMGLWICGGGVMAAYNERIRTMSLHPSEAKREM